MNYSQDQQDKVSRIKTIAESLCNFLENGVSVCFEVVPEDGGCCDKRLKVLWLTRFYDPQTKVCGEICDGHGGCWQVVCDAESRRVNCRGEKKHALAETVAFLF